MECICDLPKVEIQSYKETSHEASTAEMFRLVRPLFKHRTSSLGHPLECGCFREELLHVSDEVNWAMRQDGPAVVTIGLL